MLSIGSSLAHSKLGLPFVSASSTSAQAAASRVAGTRSKSLLHSKFAGRHQGNLSQWSQSKILSAPSEIVSSSVRTYARRPKVPTAGIQGGAVVKKKANARKLTQEERERDEDLLDDEVLAQPDLSEPYTESQVPDEMRKPMKEVKMPQQKLVFNYKTYRYKDLQVNDPDRVTAEWTVPAAAGVQVRAGEALQAIQHTKENPAEDLSKDAAISEAGRTPIGLDAPVVPYVSQITQAVYEILQDEKGEDIVVLDISGKTNWVPTMIIVTAMSSRHVVSIANRVAAELKRTRLVKNPRIERNVGDEWAIVATGTTIVEIFTPEQREYMDLERLWVLKKSAQETFEFDEEEERFMYDAEDGMWDDDDPDF